MSSIQSMDSSYTMHSYMHELREAQIPDALQDKDASLRDSVKSIQKKMNGNYLTVEQDKSSIEQMIENHKVAELRQGEREIVAHEMAHKVAGGGLAHFATYSYTKGPDGKMYKVHGEVNIDLKEGRNAKETIQKMERVKAAALAPASPSAADRQVLSMAVSKLNQARRDLRKEEEMLQEAEEKQTVYGRKAQVVKINVMGMKLHYVA